MRDRIIGDPPMPQTVGLIILVPDAMMIDVILGLVSTNHLAGPPKAPVDTTMVKRIEGGTIGTFKTNPYVIDVPDRDISPVIVWPPRNVPNQFLINNEYVLLGFPQTHNATNEYYRPCVAISSRKYMVSR